MKPQIWRSRGRHRARQENVRGAGRTGPFGSRGATRKYLDELTANKIGAVRDLYRELREADRAIDLGAPEARFAAIASQSAGLNALKTLCESLPPELRSRLWAVGSFSKG